MSTAADRVETDLMVTSRATSDLGPRGPARPRRDRGANGASLASAGTRRCIVSLHHSGASAHTAAAVLNGGGSRTTGGTRWTGRTVALVISEETAGADRGFAALYGEVRAARRMREIGELTQALTTGQLEVHYQPVVDMVSNDVASVEALVRWRHPARGLVSPHEFVPLAEECGLITELTELVARTVIEQVAAWTSAGHALRCAINLSGSSLADPSTSARLLLLLRAHARSITVEVSESVFCDAHAVAVLRQLAGYGIDIAIDDFGTGYSSLAVLKDLPASTMKIDRTFLCDIDADSRARAVVRAIVQLAHALGLDVVAEGVETESVATALRGQGVRLAQGFLYGRPMPAARLDEWLLARAAARNAA
jgi:EAL domain-containing protein (putative c-di-GMP-specific phosphodiesterase class I)